MPKKHNRPSRSNARSFEGRAVSPSRSKTRSSQERAGSVPGSKARSSRGRAVSVRQNRNPDDPVTYQHRHSRQGDVFYAEKEEKADTQLQGECDVLIIGGGASGLACAVACSQALANMRSVSGAFRSEDLSIKMEGKGRQGSDRPFRIIVLEAGKRIGASIMRSGNGRCNFSNAHIKLDRYHNASFVERTFSALENDPEIPSVLPWFEGLGLVWAEMPGSQGLLYPFSNKANSVLDVLRCALDESDVETYEHTTVRRLELAASEESDPSREDDIPVRTQLDAKMQRSFIVFGETNHSVRKTPGADDDTKTSSSKRVQSRTASIDDEVRTFKIAARHVVIATGGALPEQLAEDLSLSYRDAYALLGPLRATAPAGVSLKTLDGIRVHAKVLAEQRDFEEEGEVLFRGYGVSGIVVFNASRYVRPGDTLLLDLVPHCSADELSDLLLKRVEVLGYRRARDFLTGFMVAPLAHALLCIAGVSADDHVQRQDVSKLVCACKRFPLTVSGIADERACQVRRGGVRTSSVDPSNLEAIPTPGAYVLGEALDVDGPCGGYNLHWAWTTGLLAGADLAKKLKGRSRADQVKEAGK